MTGRFRPDELFGSDGSFREGAGVLAVGRQLEAAAAVAVDIRPSAGFADLVLAAIVAEPSPRPIAAIGRAARGGGAHALVAAVGDAWRMAWGGGRPFAVRAQAFGVVLALLVMMVSVGGLTAAGVARLLGPGPQVLAPVGPTSTPSDRPRATEEPRSTVEATPSATPSPQPTEATEPTPTDKPAATPAHTSRPTAHPTETPEGTDDHDGDSGSGSDSSGGGTATPHPTDGD
ncbi:MAG: hypothetical protein E6I94_02070 [Chloroflexi bacterium]|nr:MAG: hypothetical protein E6I94_02070 [Chloroflexota bacterium]